MSTSSSQDLKANSKTYVCGSCETPMPRFWPLQNSCPTCYPNTMWMPYKYANPLRVYQEEELYFKFDYSCVKCRKDHPDKINGVIRRFRARGGWRCEGEGLREDPSPPLWTCKACYPGPNGMWKNRKPDLPNVPEADSNDADLTSQSTAKEGKATLEPPPVSNDDDGEETNRRHSYRAQAVPAWLVRVDTNLNAIEDNSATCVE
ncbi:hypothetical protein BKA64DRAFT_637905 [Cadophora sp. MPI-SDFR-AT-0126]|nr:hypothetical protein BKA64DRAFT_637905 [Leotiomycetes sp. MPI-SDFR-AT-0126]